MVERERYEDNAYWRQRYLELLYEFAANNNELMDQVANLRKEVRRLGRENTRLRAENWQIKTNRRKRL